MEENTHILKVTKGCKLLLTIAKTDTIVIDIKNTFNKRNPKSDKRMLMK
jgi:hypothetical protein